MTALSVAISLLAGLAGAVQIAIMGRFGERTGTLPALAFSSALTALIAASVLLVAKRSLAGYGDAIRGPKWFWLGGLAGAFIVFTITFVAPKLGTFAAVGLIIVGQLVMGVVIDALGLFGSERIPLAWPRVAGVLMLSLGAALTLKK